MCLRVASGLLAMVWLLPGVVLASAPAFAAGATAPEPAVTVVYSTAGGQIDEEVRLLDLLLGQFSGTITFMADGHVDPDVAGRSTHMVYFGAVSRRLPTAVVALLSTFNGPVLAIGENVDQLGGPFESVDIETSIEVLGLAEPGKALLLFPELSIRANRIRARGEELLRGWTGRGWIPLLVRNGTAYYLATSHLSSDLFNVLSVKLTGFFGQPPPERHQAFIRLEDIHPASEAQLVAAVGHYLADRGIPFALVVIPVYTNPETLEQVHLRERPDLVAVLRELQRRGGSVVLHGYTHQYRSSETGEGFEFWDVERNTPIYFPADAVGEVKPLSAFASLAEYQAYMERLRAFERHYVRSRIERGVQELEALGLTPLAFEAPHYTMSQQGYAVVSEYFDYILGQLQLGDRDWEFMFASTYPSRPSFLRGMTLIPENVGYYDVESPTPLADMLDRMERLRSIQGAMISLFYHPYLGLDPLKPVIEAVEAIPDLEWLDLQALVDPHLLEARLRGLNNPFSLWRIMIARFGRDVVAGGWFSIVAWSMSGVAALAIGTFTILTLRSRRTLGKEMFDEVSLLGRRRGG